MNQKNFPKLKKKKRKNPHVNCVSLVGGVLKKQRQRIDEVVKHVTMILPFSVASK